MNKLYVGIVAACAALAMIVGGCGGGDEETSAAGAELSKAEFLKQGNAICAKGNKEVSKGYEAFAKERNLQNQEPTEELLAEAVEAVLLPSVTRQVEELRELGAPAGDEKQVDKILTAAEKAIEETEEKPAPAGVTTGGPFAEAKELAAAYGLKRCGE